jgi:hypothetical protein
MRVNNIATIIVISLALAAGLLFSVSHSVFDTKGYELNFGFGLPKPGFVLQGVCDRPLDTHGFPFVSKRPDLENGDCNGDTSSLAYGLNFAICFLVATTITIVGYKIAFRTKRQPK